MGRRAWMGSSLLLIAVALAGSGLAAWKIKALKNAGAATEGQPEPMEIVTTAVAAERNHRRTTTSIGTVLALQSVTLRNELPGTVGRIALRPGEIVETGAVLVELDVSVEAAELAANEARLALAEIELARVEGLLARDASSQIEVDRARAERDVARANVERSKAVIARKTIRAPFRARVGMVDLHPGQYLAEGTELTTLQGVEDAVHVDFAIPQRTAADLRISDSVEIVVASDAAPVAAEIIAIDARVDPATRNAWIRARLASAEKSPSPGASVRVRVPVGAAQLTVAIPVSALRKGPEGDHVFVIEPDPQGVPRAQVRSVRSGAMVGDEVLIASGLSRGERVAASGSFKLRPGVRVVDSPPVAAAAPR